MAEPLPTSLAGGTLRHLEQLIGGLSAGIVLIDLGGTIVWCNDAALAMHGVAKAGDLGATADEYAKRFALALPNGHRLTSREYPVMKILAGESFPDLLVQVTPAVPRSPAGRTTCATW